MSFFLYLTDLFLYVLLMGNSFPPYKWDFTVYKNNEVIIMIIKNEIFY